MLKIGKVHDYVIEGFSSNILIIYGFVGYLHSDDICVTRPVAFNIHDKSCTDLRIIEIKPHWIELNWKPIIVTNQVIILPLASKLGEKGLRKIFKKFKVSFST